MFFEISRVERIRVLIDLLREAEAQGFTLADIAIGTDFSTDKQCFIVQVPEKGVDHAYTIH